MSKLENSLDRKRKIGVKLETSRQALIQLIQRMDEHLLTRAVYGEGNDWTAVDVLRHLAEAERGMTRLIQIIRQGGEGVPSDFDLDRYNAGAVRKYRDLSVADLLQMMQVNRQALLQVLDSISLSELHLLGRHGSGRMLTVEQILRLIAEHESQHTEDLRMAVGVIEEDDSDEK